MIFLRHTLVIYGLMIYDCVISLRLLELRVPVHVLLNSEPELACRWELGSGEILYSVKWYKDGNEFFRHVPRDYEPQRKFYLPGVNVKKYDELGSKIQLSAATLETGGWYRCEVSGERPLFPTVTNHAHMLITDLPEYGPIITGFKPHYQIGDQVQVKCTSGPSRPTMSLTWYINGEPAPFNIVTSPILSRDKRGYNISSLTLSFEVSKRHFKNGRFQVKCLATLDSMYWKSNEQCAREVKNGVHGVFEMDRISDAGKKLISNNGSYLQNKFLYIMLVSCIQIISLIYV